jgi:hypothetical protein
MNVVENLKYGFTVFRFLRNQACLGGEGDRFQHLLKHALSHIHSHYMRKCKVFTSAVSLVSFFISTPCIILTINSNYLPGKDQPTVYGNGKNA